MVFRPTFFPPLFWKDIAAYRAKGKPDAAKKGVVKAEKSKKKKEEEETAISDAAEKCPWCGKDMEWGVIGGAGRESSVIWRNWQPKGLLDLAGTENGKMFDLLDEGGGMRWFKTVWLCEDCGKMVLDRPKQRIGPNYVWEGGKVKLPEEDNDGILEEK